MTSVDSDANESMGTAAIIETGNAALTNSNYNVISWAAVPWAASYNIYRTASGGTPATTGLIANQTGVTLNDKGLTPTASSPPAAPTLTSISVPWNAIASVLAANITITVV